jgi:hypothetical protein
MEKWKTAGPAFMWTSAVLVLLLFLAGIWVAADYTLWVEGAPRPNDMPAIISYFVSAVNGTLAANLGALFGISISLGGWRGPQNKGELLQWMAAGFYVVGLSLAVLFWGLAGFTDDSSKVVSLLPEMTKNAVGIFIAILAAVLGVQTALTHASAVSEKGGERVAKTPSQGPR